MSPVWLYCVTTPDGDAPDGLRGVGDAPVRTEDVEGLRAWYAEPDPTPSPSAVGVARHHGVVEAAWSATLSCAPARFGQTFRDVEALRVELAGRVHETLGSLASLEDSAEMGLRIFPEDSPEGDGPEAVEPPVESPRGEAVGPGRAYLEQVLRTDRALRNRDEARRALADRVAAPVAHLLLASRVDANGPEDGGVALAHLVPRRSIQGYRDAMERFAAACDDLRIVVEGPWPPYSFVSRSRGDGP